MLCVGTTYRFWRKADWVSTDVFQLNEETGHVAVLQPGVYLIYAQVIHHTITPRLNSYSSRKPGSADSLRCLLPPVLKENISAKYTACFDFQSASASEHAVEKRQSTDRSHD